MKTQRQFKPQQIERHWNVVVEIIPACVWTCTVIVNVFKQGDWIGQYQIGRRTWTIHLPESPVWDAPPVPEYDDFRSVFDGHSDRQQPGCVIVRELRWRPMLLSFLFHFWVIAIVTFTLYWRGGWRRGIRDPILILSSSIALGLSLAGIACVVLWIVFGGWGPPIPLGLAFCGIAAGTVAGFAVIYRSGNDQPRPSHPD